MDEVDAIPMPRKRRPKDSFQNELQAKLYQRRSLGLSAEVTDSDDDMQTSPYIKDYQSNYSNRPASAKRRPDKSPDLGRGLGTTTMRSRDLTQLLHQNSGHLDEDDDEDEEVMAANLGRSNAMSSWQTPGLKTPSPKQDPRYQRKTPTRESPKDSSRLESIYGRRTPTRESPKEQGKLDSMYGRKTPTKDASPRALTKEELIFGRKTPTSSGDGQRFPGMDSSKDKPWQPPNFRSVSPSSSTEHSRGSRGVTPIDSNLEPIDESYGDRVTPRLQRGERIREDDSPKHASFGDRPKPQSRSKFGDKKSPLFDRKSPQVDRKSPQIDSKSPLIDRKSPLDRKSTLIDRKSPHFDSPASRDTTSSLKRATPTYDLFGKSRSSAAQEVEDFIHSDKKTDPRYDRPGAKTIDGRKTSPERSKYPVYGQDKSKKDAKVTGSKGLSQTTPTGKKTPIDNKKGYDRKSPATAKDDLRDKKSPRSNQSSLLDFLTGGQSDKPKAQTRGSKEKRNLDDDIDDMFGNNQKYMSSKSPSNQYKSMYDERKSPVGIRKPSLSNKMPSEEQRKSPDYLSRRINSIAGRDEDYKEQRQRSPERFEESPEKQRKIPKSRKDDASSVCEEIPLDPNLKMLRAEEKALKSGKQRTDRAKADNAIDTIAEAQTMKYIEPAKKIRPITAEAKVQHRPKPRYGNLPGTQTQTKEQEFNSTSDIRDAIYEKWYEERLKAAKKKKKEEEKKKLEEEEKEKKEKQEKDHEAQMSYKAWVEMKKETVFREKAIKQRKEIEKKHQENQEKQEKEEEALKSFAHWKENKDAMIRHELHKKRQTEEEKLREKEEEEYKKRKDRESAFKGWKSKKHHELKEQQRQYRQQKDQAKMKQREEKDNQRIKEEEALKRYEEWMDTKELFVSFSRAPWMK